MPRSLLLLLATAAMAATALLSGCAWPRSGSLPGRAAPPAGADPERLLAAMTVEQKVGQVMIVSFTGPTFSAEAEQMVRAYHAGGVILFQQNLLDRPQIQQLTRQLQAAARVPLLIAADQEGGPVVRVTRGATLFPSQMAVGATFSPAAAAAVAGATAGELRALGLNVNFGPVVDVNSNPQNPVIGVRAYGADAALVGQLATAAIGATQQAGVLAVAKHFPGHGDADVDSHLALPLIGHDLQRLETVELPPFRAAIGAGVDGIMTAHVVLPALEKDPRRPATLSAPVLGYLRQRLGYPGLIITDDLQMGAIVNDYGTAEAAKLAFQAGADLLLFRRNVAEQQRAHALLVAAVKSGEISADRLDASVQRILQAKARRGLLERGSAVRGRGSGERARPAGGGWQAAAGAAGTPSAPPRAGEGAQAPEPAARGGEVVDGAAVALDVARRSLTLVKNDRHLLPLELADRAPLCAIFPHPESIAGVEIAAAPVTPSPTAGSAAGTAGAAAAGDAGDGPPTLGDALKARHANTRPAPVHLRPTTDEAQAALACARQAQVVVFGSYNLHEYPSQAALARSVVALGKPVVVVALRLPYDLGELGAAQALLATYSNRPVSLRAAAEALLGRGAAPTGHLPVPVEPRWPLGFGLLDWSRPDTLDAAR